MNALFSNYNYKIRNESRIIEDESIIRKRDRLLHVCINSKGCCFRKSGSCVMCNYGQGQSVSEDAMCHIMNEVADQATDIDSILIGTLGSVFDQNEISPENLQIICDRLNQIPVETIIFETHYTMIKEELCVWLKKKLPEKDIVIEIGLESADEFVLEECLLKKINLYQLKEKIDLLHEFHMSVTANVLLGSPFLSVREQIQDTVETVKWAIRNGIDSVVIFPINIRKDTLLEYLYRHGKYDPVYHWQMLEVLQNIPTGFLNRIHFAWYGNLIDRNEDGSQENIPPVFCEECRNKWFQFYSDFLLLKSNEERKAYINTYAKETDMCTCRREYIEKLNKTDGKSREDRVEEIKTWLSRNAV